MTTYLTSHAYFKNTNDMNEAVKQHISAKRNNMNDSDRAVLDVIHRHSAIHDAAHLNHKTIENSIQKSNTTVRRSIRKLEKLGIIARIHYIRPVMNGLGANIYVIKPFNEQLQNLSPSRPKH